MGTCVLQRDKVKCKGDIMGKIDYGGLSRKKKSLYRMGAYCNKFKYLLLGIILGLSMILLTHSKRERFEDDIDDPLNESNIIKTTLKGTEQVFDWSKYNQLYPVSRGWWSDVINCSQSGEVDLYCKPKEDWIWPY
jgi:hypothetical protein